MNELTIEEKARLYDIEQSFHNQLGEAKYQLFRIMDNKWFPVLAKDCAPIDEEDHHKTMAIIDGVAYEVEIKPAGASKVWFSDGNDCEMEYSFKLIANGVLVGSCSHREY